MRELARRLLERCRAGGAARAEVYIKTGETRAVNLDPGGRVNWSRTAEGGIGLRVFRGDGATGFASLCGPSPSEPAQTQLVDAAIDAARSPAPIFPLATGRPGEGRGLGIFDPRLHTATLGDLEGSLDEAAAEALRVDPRVRRLDTASIAASSSRIHLHNTEGLEGTYRQTLVHLALGVVAEDAGNTIVFRQSRTARSLSAFSPALLGDRIARLAATALEGRPPRAGRFTALLAPAAAVEILRLFARGLIAGVPLPEPGPASRLTIIDDGRLPGGVATAPFDGEGVATRRNSIVSRGRAGEILHDLASARRHGASSTGNGIRVSFRDPPRLMTSNLFIAPGSEEPDDLMEGIEEGIWLQFLRPTTAMHGDSTMLAAIGSGRWIEKGRPRQGISGALVIASLPELLAGVIGVGNDLTFGFPSGSFGAPSLLIKEVELRAPWS